VQIAIEVRMF